MKRLIKVFFILILIINPLLFLTGYRATTIALQASGTPIYLPLIIKPSTPAPPPSPGIKFYLCYDAGAEDPYYLSKSTCLETQREQYLYPWNPPIELSISLDGDIEGAEYSFDLLMCSPSYPAPTDVKILLNHAGHLTELASTRIGAGIARSSSTDDEDWGNGGDLTELASTRFGTRMSLSCSSHEDWVIQRTVTGVNPVSSPGDILTVRIQSVSGGPIGVRIGHGPSITIPPIR